MSLLRDDNHIAMNDLWCYNKELNKIYEFQQETYNAHKREAMDSLSFLPASTSKDLPHGSAIVRVHHEQVTNKLTLDERGVPCLHSRKL